MRVVLALLGMVVAVALASMPARAQEITPTPVGSQIAVRGVITNRSESGEVRAGIEVMLHAWDSEGAARMMLHGTSNADGSFEFEGVELEPVLTYAVMATYQDVAYSSNPVQPIAGEFPFIEVPVYETMSDIGGAVIDLLYIVIGTGQGGLAISEFYALSNSLDRTISEALTLEDGTSATLVFALPPEAANATFPPAPRERFRVFPGGFADLQPLIPGKGTGEIAVNYVLPYEDRLGLERRVPLEAGEILVFLPDQMGIELEIPGARYEGVQRVGSRQVPYGVHRLGPLQAGDVIDLTLSGEFEDPLADLREVSPGSPGIGSLRPLAMVVAGGLVIGSGLWLWRVLKVEGDEEDEELGEMSKRGAG